MFLLLTLACTRVPPAIGAEPEPAEPAGPETTVHRDLAWSEDHGVDVYVRDDDRPKRLLVFVHGGSWVGGSKGNLSLAPDLVDWFVDRDFVVAAIDFPLATGPGDRGAAVRPVDQAHAVAEATGWVREQAAEWGVTDPRPVWMGFSSGAHLVALAAADEAGLASAGASMALPPMKRVEPQRNPCSPLLPCQPIREAVCA